MEDHECPSCGETLEVGEFDSKVTCLECQNSWIVDRDAEFDNGSWRDLSKLIPV